MWGLIKNISSLLTVIIIIIKLKYNPVQYKDIDFKGNTIYIKIQMF